MPFFRVYQSVFFILSTVFRQVKRWISLWVWKVIRGDVLTHAGWCTHACGVMYSRLRGDPLTGISLKAKQGVAYKVPQIALHVVQINQVVDPRLLWKTQSTKTKKSSPHSQAFSSVGCAHTLHFQHSRHQVDNLTRQHKPTNRKHVWFQER